MKMTKLVSLAALCVAVLGLTGCGLDLSSDCVLICNIDRP